MHDLVFLSAERFAEHRLGGPSDLFQSDERLGPFLVIRIGQLLQETTLLRIADGLFLRQQVFTEESDAAFATVKKGSDACKTGRRVGGGKIGPEKFPYFGQNGHLLLARNEPHALNARKIPEKHRRVRSAGRQHPAVPTEGQALHRPLASVEAEQFAAGEWVEEASAILCRDHEAMAIRRECEVLHACQFHNVCREFFACPAIEELKSSFRGPDRCHLTVR